VTGTEAAALLGVSHQRVNQLAVGGRLPYVTHRNGTRLYRREQLEVVAQARDAMWH
jgi:excisionase family DNA binding protein